VIDSFLQELDPLNRDVIFPPFRGNPPFDSILEKIKTFGFDLK
jgi:hypothetical protein